MFNRKTKSLLLVLVMLVSTAGVAFAAAPTVDTETTNTASTSDLTNGGTQTYNATTASTLNWSADSPNASVEITQNGETLFTATPDHYSAVDTGTDGNPDLWYYNVSLADDGANYDGLDANAGESVSLNVTLTNNTEAASPDTTNLSYTFANGNAEAFANVGDTDVQTPAEGGIASSLAFWGDNDTDPAQLESKTVGIEGNQTETVTVSVAGTPMADALDASTESTEAGDVIWSAAASMDGEYIAVADTEQPDTEWFENGSTYAVYDSDSKTLTYHNVDERTTEGMKDLELSATGNDGIGFSNTVSMLQSYDASNAYLTAAFNADYNEPDWEDDS